MTRQKHTHGSKNRSSYNDADHVDYYDSAVATDFAGFVDPILDGSAIFDELLYWIDDTDTSRNRINGDETPITSIQHISGNMASVDPYPNALDKLSSGMSDFLRNPSTDDQSAERSGKHRCWDHGCNGREFSSKSNFVRHVKERSGASTKGVCPLCGAIFTRNSARDTHLAKQSCNRIRRYSNGRPRPSRLAVLGNPRLAAAAAAATQDIHWQAVDWGSCSMDDSKAAGFPPPN
ncbi:hypothetical protein F4811DRAFT_550210 [Daldinia bambusicola]|nr:hypothetical protein F4811DRAFT_550210 [Daldinia bambusicola]